MKKMNHHFSLTQKVRNILTNIHVCTSIGVLLQTLCKKLQMLSLSLTHLQSQLSQPNPTLLKVTIFLEKECCNRLCNTQFTIDEVVVNGGVCAQLTRNELDMGKLMSMEGEVGGSSKKQHSSK